MKTLFLVAVVSSIGYLVYQESPRIDDVFSTSWFQSGNSQITMESIKRDMQKQLDDVTADREALYELLAEKEALLMAKKQQKPESESTAPLVYSQAREQTVQESGQYNRQYGENSKRRDALRELAQRMELQALGLNLEE